MKRATENQTLTKKRSRFERSGQGVGAAAGLELDRGPEEMGGMPKSAGRSGASHAMTVNETVIAMIRPKPDLDLVADEPAEAVAAAQA
ncbi:hypothetical protein ALMP_12550 [Streptomyces sp. A012304]|nr:hypothetical protein ALMP_12550 [Streptomyces sp. A012304]